MLERLQDYIISLWVVSSPRDDTLLLQAFTHKSFSADSPQKGIPFNERLEFLWDSLLWSYVAAALYGRYPDYPESKLTLAKIFLVKEQTLAKVARNIDLWAYIRLGNWEERSGWRDKDAVLSDTLEACIAYLYLDHGAQSVERFVKKYIMTQLDTCVYVPEKSAKSRLQEYVQKHCKEIPVYTDIPREIEASGNVALYASDVSVQWEHIAQWIWPSKKKAQEKAAQKALDILEHI